MSETALFEETAEKMGLGFDETAVLWELAMDALRPLERQAYCAHELLRELWLEDQGEYVPMSSDLKEGLLQYQQDYGQEWLPEPAPDAPAPPE